MDGIIKKLKEKYGGCNYLIHVHNVDKYIEFLKYDYVELFGKKYYKVPMEIIGDISYEKTLEIDFALTFGDEIGTEYTKHYRRYEFLSKGCGKIAYTVYIKINGWHKYYAEFMESFKKNLTITDSTSKAIEQALHDVGL